MFIIRRVTVRTPANTGSQNTDICCHSSKQVTEDSLRYSIESTMADGTGCVADIRLAEEEGTGRKKGFAFVDFVDVPSAERACKELQGASKYLK